MNDKPYYSEDNGFLCASAGRGITEALREHLNVIIRDENLKISFNHDQYQQHAPLAPRSQASETSDNSPRR